MALRIHWDKYETALLIETYLSVQRGNIDKKNGVRELSKVLRKRAVNAGIEIDEKFRNENGIAMQYSKIKRLMHRKQDPKKHNTKMFIDMVNMYFYDRDQFDLILNEAKGTQPKRYSFYPTLSNQEQIQETMYIVDFENGSDYAFTRPVSVSYFGDVSDVSSWRGVYIKTCQLLLKDYPDVFRRLCNKDVGDLNDCRLIVGQKESSRFIDPVRIGDDFFVDTKRNATDLILNIKRLLDYCRVDYEDLIICYENRQEKKLDATPVIMSEETPSKESSAKMYCDSVIEYLKQVGIEYVDHRHELGCLWIIGGREITDKMKILDKNGVRMHFKAGGGYATNGRDAWWTKDSASVPVVSHALDETESVEQQKGVASITPASLQNQSCSRKTIQDVRNSFKEYMLNLDYSVSTANGMTSAVSVVSDYASAHGFQSHSLFLTTDYHHLQSIWNLLQNDRDFSEYNRSQNRRFTVAMKHYLAFIEGFGTGEEHLGTSQKPSSIKTHIVDHPGKIEFENWLKERNYPFGSIKTYLSSVDSIGKYLLENDLEDRYIFAIRGIVRLERIQEALLTDKNYEMKVGANNMRFYLNALKKYISFRKNDSPNNLDESTQKRYSDILRGSFENGFRVNRMIDRNRFKQFYADAYGEELSETDEQILDILKQIGSLQDNRIYLRDSAVQNDLLDDIHAEIAKVFKAGISCVYLSELFARHQEQLTAELNIYSSDVLKEQLLWTSYGAYCTSKHYFYQRDRLPDASMDIQRLMQKSNIPLSYDDIYDRLFYIPLDTIKNRLGKMDKIVKVAQETYFYAPNLPINSYELKQIAELIHKQLQQRSYITDVELRSLIQQHCPAVAINTESYTTMGLRKALSVLLGETFSFKGRIISERGQKVNMAQVFTDFCRSHEKMTIDELKQFAEELNTYINWEPVYEEMVRVSPKEFILKDHIQFDIPSTDSVLNELISGDYQALQDFTLFLHLPVINISWNLFVLESYAANYSKDFVLLHARYTEKDCCGAVVRRDSEIRDFKDLVLDVLVNSQDWNNKNDALNLLVNKGYLQKHTYKEIDVILPKAKIMREKRIDAVKE